MKLSFLKGLLVFISILVYSQNNAQVFWTETFGAGCNTGTLANGFASPNGAWSVSSTGTNGADANVWYISAEENGEGVGNCGAGCGNNPTLHISAGAIDAGAAYLNGDGGFGFDATTSKRAESPVIDCTGECGIELTFEYMENGDGANDDLSVWYFDGSVWNKIDDTPKTATTCAPQGLWTAYTLTLPGSANNNPNVQIGFQWVNNNDNTGTDPSAAIYNIQLSSNDTEAPTMNCVTDVNVYVDQNCDAAVPDLELPPFVAVNDNCTSIANILVNQDIPAGTVISGHLTVVEVEIFAEDESGNVNSCLLDVRSVDTISPDLTCPANQPAYANASCESTVDDYLSLATVSDNCTVFGDLVIGQNVASGTPMSSDQVVEISATDLAGNTSTCSFTVELVDTISPNITCPSNQTQETEVGTCDTLIRDYTDQVIWNDNCTSSALDMTFQQSPSPMSTISGATTVTLTAIDSSGNSKSCNIEVTVIDMEDPTITCPADQTLPTNSACNASLPDYTGDATAGDNCPALGGIQITQVPAPGTLVSGEGTVQTVTLTAEDDSGNTSSCDFDVTLTDTTNPQAFCPSNTTESSDVNCEFSVPDYSGATTGTDNCFSVGDFTITQDIAVGTVLNAGVHQIEMSVEDPSGNVGTCTFELTVEDNMAPTITNCAPDQVEPSDASCNAVLTDYTGLVTANDNCDVSADLAVTQSPAVGSSISGPTTVTLTVTDLSGNFSTCDLEVTIDDQEDPTIMCPSDSIVNVNASCDYLAPDLTGVVTGSDNCSAFADMTVTQNPASGTNLSGADVIEVILTDENGNSTSCFINTIPNDITPPTVTCPANQSVNNGTDCNYQITDYTGMASATDNCPGVVLTQNPAVGTEIGTGTHNVEIIATDGSGNADTCSFELAVTESIDPTINCPANISTCDPIVTYAAPIANDNCAGIFVSQIDGSGLSSGDQFPVGITIQTYEVTDPSGNTASCTFNVEVLQSPSQANVLTEDTQLCDTTSIVIEADPATSGTGEWILASGSGNFNNEFANITGVNNMTYGSNVFVWEISSADCGSTTDTVVVTVFQEPLPASTQDTLFLCSDTSLNISANQPSVGIGTWGDASGSVSFLDENSPNTLAYNFSSGWNDLSWTISNGNCPVTSDTLSIFNKLETEIFTGDTSVCAGNSIVLNGTDSPQGVNSIWYVINGAADFETASNSSTLVYNLGGGDNTIVFGQNHPICGTTLDTITVTIGLCGEYDPIIPTVITPNGDGVNDLLVIENLNILYPDNEVKIVNRWGGLVFESTGYEEPWNGTRMNEGEPLPMGSYFYRIILNDDQGTEITGPISIIR
ncbi:MAG: hypothetical protein COA32_04955 [Fluviicola sp.]|nr:MAG: hypothetical protein COA32_04955 [Fluviicola sp.]